MYWGPWTPYAHDALAGKGMSRASVTEMHDSIHQRHARAVLYFFDWFGELRNKSPQQAMHFLYCRSHLEHVQSAFSEFIAYLHFWPSMSPTSGGTLSQDFGQQLVEAFGSLCSFRRSFTSVAFQQHTPGWVFLVREPGGGLTLEGAGRTDNPFRQPERTPLLVCNVQEQAYYLDHRSDLEAYIANWLRELAHFSFAEQRDLVARQQEGRSE